MIKYKDKEYTQYNPYKRPVKLYAEEFEKIENLKCESGNFIQLIFFASTRTLYFCAHKAKLVINDRRDFHSMIMPVQFLKSKLLFVKQFHIYTSE